MKSWAPDSRAAAWMRSSVASGSAKAMLSAMVELKRKVSSNTRPTARRRCDQVGVADVDAVEGDPTGPRRRRSGGCSRATVDLPLPVAPTSATDSPAGDVEHEVVEDRGSGAGLVAEVTSSKRTAPRPWWPSVAPAGSGVGCGGETMAGSVASTASTRCAEAAARWAWAMIMPSIRSGQISR